MSHITEMTFKQSWGWVLYRTDYAPNSDANWTKFLEIWTTWVTDHVRHDGPSRLADTIMQQHHMTFISNKELFDGATFDQLRTHFAQWLTEQDFSGWKLGGDNDKTGWPDAYMFMVADKEVLDEIEKQNPSRRVWLRDVQPFVKAVDKNNPQEQHYDDLYPGWMKVSLLSPWNVYVMGMELPRMRGLVPLAPESFSDDNYPRDAYGKSYEDEPSSEDPEESDVEVDSGDEEVQRQAWLNFQAAHSYVDISKFCK